MTLTAKNTAPTVEKKIIVGNDRVDKTTASIGDELSFRVNITAYKGAESYILHDQMDTGLTFNKDSVTVMDTGSQPINSENYKVATTELGDDCTFHVVFNQAYLNTINATTTIRVHYKATLNSDAKVVSAATDSNDNKAHLTYGSKPYATTDSVVQVQTFQVQLVKSDDDYKVLTGATFRLYDQETEGNEIQVVKDEDGVYRVAATDAEKESAVAIEAGTPVIQGLGNGTYYLEEVTAPDGYNKVESRVLFTVKDTNNLAVFTDATNTVYDNSKGGGVLVKNSKGILLPNTGGTGILFLYVGGVLLVAAGCLLALRRRKKNS
jgi:fimbrial isopeptide formation D2 family protein/LPXTG-motif cell wall-anchored protein